MDAFTRLVAGYGMLDDDSALQEGAAQGASTVRRRREPVTKLGHDAVPRGEADEEKA